MLNVRFCPLPGVSCAAFLAVSDTLAGMDKYGQVPMYFHPGNHQAFVRYELVYWPDKHHQWVVYCPGCEQMARAGCEDYQTAYEIALEHRGEEDAWMPKEAVLWGPRSKWGPAL